MTTFMNIAGGASAYLQEAIILDDNKPLNFGNYKAYAPLLDLPVVRKITFRTARQVGKSIFMSCNVIKYAHVPKFRMSYIVPMERQMSEFSRMKLGLILNYSPNLKLNLLDAKSPLVPPELKLDSGMIINDIKLKVFSTGASLKLGYACDAVGVERLRGGSNDLLIYDEAQSSDLDSVEPILEPTLDSSDYAIRMYAGTPLDENDPLSVRFEETSQHTMLVKCPHCNRYSTLMHVKQIRPEGVTCFFCDGLLPIHEGRFYPMNPTAAELGFHINKLMFPGIVYHPVKWNDLVKKVNNPRSNPTKIDMEDLGVPRSTSSKLLTRTDILNCGLLPGYDPDNFNEVLAGIKLQYGETLVYSVDWGGGADDHSGESKVGKSHTVESLNICKIEYGFSKMKTVHHKVYPLANVRECIDTIHTHVKMLPPNTYITTDYMGGAYGNSAIYQYVANTPHKNLTFLPCQLLGTSAGVQMSDNGDHLAVDRNRILPRYFRKVICKETLFAKDTALIKEIADHFLAEVEIINEDNKRMWRKRSGTSDDILYSCFFAWVVYCYKQGLLKELIV